MIWGVLAALMIGVLIGVCLMALVSVNRGE